LKKTVWTAFSSVFGLNALLLIIDWNSRVFGGHLRFIIGVPLALIGALLVSWGIATLGVQITSGHREGFVSSGPYKFTRNPQYLGDMILFVGLGFIANSRYLWTAHILIIILFAITSLAEESNLEEEYGEKYIEYKRDTSRFL
jgi:protein-S-isoprenylcysteine O-methyltransferase Ste14